MEEVSLLPKKVNHAYFQRFVILFVSLAISGVHIWAGFIGYDTSLLDKNQQSNFKFILGICQTCGICFSIASIHLERRYSIYNYSRQKVKIAYEEDKVKTFELMLIITGVIPLFLVFVSWFILVSSNLIIDFPVPVIVLTFIVGLIELSFIGVGIIIGLIKCMPTFFEFYC